MEYLAIAIMFILAFFDSGIVVFILKQPQFLIESLVVHIIIYLIIISLDKLYLDKYKGVPIYLAFFFPGIGAIIISILYFSLSYFLRDGMILWDYERYITYDRLFDDNVEKTDYKRETQTLSFLDQINLLDAKSKKELIVDLGIHDYASKVKLLQQSLSDSDKEVQYYSAVTLNMLENEYTHVINELREQYILSQDIELLQQLINVYKNYIESDFLKGEVLEVINNEYIDALNKYLELKKEKPHILNELVKAYIRRGDLIQAETVNEKLLTRYPETTFGIYNKIYMAYEKGEYKEVKDLMKTLGKDKSIQLQSLCSFWYESDKLEINKSEVAR